MQILSFASFVDFPYILSWSLVKSNDEVFTVRFTGGEMRFLMFKVTEY